MAERNTEKRVFGGVTLFTRNKGTREGCYDCIYCAGEYPNGNGRDLEIPTGITHRVKYANNSGNHQLVIRDRNGANAMQIPTTPEDVWNDLLVALEHINQESGSRMGVMAICEGKSLPVPQNGSDGQS